VTMTEREPDLFGEVLVRELVADVRYA